MVNIRKNMKVSQDRKNNYAYSKRMRAQSGISCVSSSETQDNFPQTCNV
jgi:hypothetical protein